MEVQFRGNLAFLLQVAQWLGYSERPALMQSDKTRVTKNLKTPKEVESLLRLLTPILKLFTAKEAMVLTSEGIEFFGAYGYIEESHIPVIMRDA